MPVQPGFTATTDAMCENGTPSTCMDMRCSPPTVTAIPSLRSTSRLCGTKAAGSVVVESARADAGMAAAKASHAAAVIVDARSAVAVVFMGGKWMRRETGNTS